MLTLVCPIVSKSKIPNISLGLNITVSGELLVTSNVAEFLTNLTLGINVLCTILSKSFTQTNPDISSMNGASIVLSISV